MLSVARHYGCVPTGLVLVPPHGNQVSYTSCALQGFSSNALLTNITCIVQLNASRWPEPRTQSFPACSHQTPLFLFNTNRRNRLNSGRQEVLRCLPDPYRHTVYAVPYLHAVTPPVQL